jgi:aminopeptidase N
MEYPRYEASEDVYQEETTYIKGALVLHMLSRVVGDEGFYRGLRDFLHRHAFRNADSADLEESLRGATGRNLASFFADWIVGGGGHPVFSVSYRFSPERGQVDLAVEQLQADQPFENDFRLPVEVEIVTASGARVHLIEVAGWSTKASLPADARPLAVVFDKGGWLVSEVRFERSLPETLYLLRHGALAERLRAARQLATDFPRRPETAPALGSVLADAEAHWGLRQEAAHDLGAVGGEPATTALAVALRDPDRRVRRAAAVALGRAGGARAPEALRRAIEADAAEDVVASAALSLGRSHAPGAREVLLRQLSRASRWWDVIRVGALSGLAELEDPALASTFAPWTDAAHNHDVRLAALEGWLRAAPEDPRLAVRLRELAGDRNRRVRAEALETLGKLHRADDLPMLKQIAADEDDPNLARVAREAVVEVESFVGKKGGPGEVKP